MQDAWELQVYQIFHAAVRRQPRLLQRQPRSIADLAIIFDVQYPHIGASYA
ncbi:MAG: hypothetical protein JWM42_3631 [Burkholderia sp.]|nr:hypothetical protein [Burkholderia sp.]